MGGSSSFRPLLPFLPLLTSSLPLVKHLGKGAVGKVVSSYVTPLAPLARYAGLDTRQISDLLRALLDGYYGGASCCFHDPSGPQSLITSSIPSPLRYGLE